MPNCICCGCEMAHWLRVPMLVPEPDSRFYQLYRCPGCGLGTVWPRPKWDHVAPHYERDDYYTHRSPARQSSQRPPLVARIAWRADNGNPLTAERIGKSIALGATVCELGCGSGVLLSELSKIGFAVVGVEPDGRARAAASERGVHVVAGTAERLPIELPCGSFDVVIMSHVLEHCLEPTTALVNVWQLLKPGGLALFTVPNHECIGQRRAGVSWRWIDLPRHVSFFTGGSLRKLCETCGLIVEAMDYNGYVRQFGREWLAEEHRIRASFGMRKDPSPWNLLVQTFRAPDPLKYDSVTVTARKAGRLPSAPRNPPSGGSQNFTGSPVSGADDKRIPSEQLQ